MQQYRATGEYGFVTDEQYLFKCRFGNIPWAVRSFIENPGVPLACLGEWWQPVAGAGPDDGSEVAPPFGFQVASKWQDAPVPKGAGWAATRKLRHAAEA